MPAWALYCILLRRATQEFDTLTLLFMLDAFASLFLAPALLIENQYFRPLQFSWPALWAILYIGGVTSCLAYLCWNRGIELVGPGRAGITMHLLPGFTALWAILFLGEDLHPYHVIGIAVILSGVWLASSGRRP
jgi:drug/metabolite transporter (DMT)-like permease